MGKLSSNNLSLYVHIPFCSRRCGYCHFNTYEGLEKLFEPFTLALCKEIESYARELSGAWIAHTIYIGGGTPTHLPLKNFLRIIQVLREQFAWIPGIEITSEANPTFITQAYLEGIREAGVNRISFGAQSFDANLLSMLDREHSAAQIGEAVRAARQAGFTNLNLDLMYGLPHQTLTQWNDSLDAAIALEPNHLSLYALTIDEGTAFKKRVEKKILPEPDPDLAADMYLLAEEKLAEEEFQQYEISNWARLNSGGDANDRSCQRLKASRHNLTYWLTEPYLGFGPGAHSFFKRERFWSVLAPQVYIEKIARNESVVAGRESIDEPLERSETIILALRLNEGISRARFAERFGIAMDDQFGSTLKQCAEWGLVEDAGDRVRLTTRGRLLSNEVFQRLLPDTGNR